MPTQMTAHESVRFLFVCRERPGCRSHPAWAENGERHIGRSLRCECGYAPFRRNAEGVLARTAERSMTVPYITLFGNRTLGPAKL